SGKNKEQMPLQFPWIPGFDCAGIVDMVGEGVKHFKPGEAVYFKCMGGSYAGYIVADPDQLVKIPHTLSMPEAATVPHVGLTAWQGLFRHGNLQSGGRVLIHGGAGAVGMFAVQFARTIGATVYATSSAGDMSFVQSLGADVVIDYHSTDFTTVAKEMDLVFDLVGGDTQQRSYGVLKKGGHLVSTVGITDPQQAKAYEVTAIPMVVESNGDELQQLSDQIIAGQVVCDVAEVYPLEEVTTAWETFLRQNARGKEIRHGKIVLEIMG
ncbi:MAG: NADP-dependent oxidoreductase, partial [Tannerellaceae bacterium]|nr:NADP-dependent oxidoreductase [Tannerellaceae bacterium]